MNVYKYVHVFYQIINFIIITYVIINNNISLSSINSTCIRKEQHRTTFLLYFLLIKNIRKVHYKTT